MYNFPSLGKFQVDRIIFTERSTQFNFNRIGGTKEKDTAIPSGHDAATRALNSHENKSMIVLGCLEKLKK